MTSDGLVRPAPFGTASGIGRRDRLYVWVWLPGTTEPVVAGALTRTGDVLQGEPVLVFTYARSYRSRGDAMSMYPEELPLQAGTFDPSVPGPGRSPLPLHGCLRDAAPDAWGRRVLNLRWADDPDADLSELDYLACSDSNRIGALDFQDSSTEFVPRGGEATLSQLAAAAELVEAGVELPPALVAAAGHGTSIGGARPKALLSDGRRQLVAKFSSTTDTRPVVQAEAAATVLAGRVGLTAPRVEVMNVNGRHVLLLERFDREAGGDRRAMLSALTLTGRHELQSRDSSYPELAAAVRTGPWRDVPGTLRELFTRMVFNVCIGNTDDHLRNHAAFWDGTQLQLTPAYDLTPQPRSTSVATHAIAFTRQGERHSQLRLCRSAAAEFLLTPGAANGVIDHVVSTIRDAWQDACDVAGLASAQARTLMGREILNPYIFYDHA